MNPTRNEFRALWTLVAAASAVILLVAPAPAETAAAAVSWLPASPVQETLDELFYDWQAYEVDVATFEREARTHGRVDLRLGGRLYELELEPVDLRAPGFREAWIGADGRVTERLSPVGTFAGHLAGQPTSEVRLLILPDLLQGYIRTEESWLFLDPMVKFGGQRGWPARNRQVVAYEESDVKPGRSILCGTEALGQAARKLDITEDSLRSVTDTASSGSLHEVQVATEADFEYQQIYGSNTNSQIAGILNQVDGVYEGELGLTLTISYQSVWTSSSDPYTASAASNRLDQFRSYWNSNRTTVSRDVAHMFTGVDLDSSIIGVAYVGVVCSDPGFSYGLSQDFSMMTKLVSHEIGHNLDAIHVDAYDASLCDGSGPIMCPSIQSSGPNTFSSFSENDIGDHVSANGSCLTLIGPDACFSIEATSSTFVAVDASCSSTDSGSITSYHWDWGDGFTGSGETATHSYSFAGTYTVTLTVTDSDGLTDSTSKETNSCLLFRADDALCAP